MRRKLRRVLSTPYFNEGWALYSERVMREQGLLHRAHRRSSIIWRRHIFRAARIVVDTSLHMGEMTVDEAIEFLQHRLAMAEPTARAEVGRYCAWPTQASSYLTGCLEILRIRGVARARAAWATCLLRTYPPRPCANSTTPSRRRARCPWALPNG